MHFSHTDSAAKRPWNNQSVCTQWASSLPGTAGAIDRASLTHTGRAGDSQRTRRSYLGSRLAALACSTTFQKATERHVAMVTVCEKKVSLSNLKLSRSEEWAELNWTVSAEVCAQSENNNNKDYLPFIAAGWRSRPSRPPVALPRSGLHWWGRNRGLEQQQGGRSV